MFSGSHVTDGTVWQAWLARRRREPDSDDESDGDDDDDDKMCTALDVPRAESESISRIDKEVLRVEILVENAKMRR